MALAKATRSLMGRFMLNSRPSRSFASLGEMDISPQMDASSTSIDAWDDFGYQVNGIYMRGSVLCFPTFTMLWDVQQVDQITKESLSPVFMFQPQPRVLLVGTGEEMLNIDPTLFGHFSRQGVSIEHMSSHNAMATFNILNQEGRPAAAALLCRSPVTRDEACFYTNGTHDHVEQLREGSPEAGYDVYDMTKTPRGQATRSGDLVSGAFEERRRTAAQLGQGGARASFLEEQGSGARSTAVRSHLND